MRDVHKALRYLGLVVVGAAVQGVACANTAEDCALIGTPCPGQAQPATSSVTSGGGGGSDPLCEQSPKDNQASVVDSCGVFVKSGAMGGTGSMASPLPTLNAGIDAAVAQQKKRVYVCLGSYTELLTVPAGITLYGGLDCAKSWAVTDMRSTLKGAADKIPLTLEGGAEQTRIENLDVTAVDAALPGGSSIAALALAGSTVHFEGTNLTAAIAQAGGDGMSADSMAPTAPAKSSSGIKACTNIAKNDGGALNQNSCDPPQDPLIPEYSFGGDGGYGTPAIGQTGTDGTSTPETAVPAGVGGKGATTCINGGEGGVGSDGAEGAPGVGGMGEGVLSTTQGWTGVAGGDGGKGMPGQGGGGGGGQKGKTMCAGASGGAGGAGGCGGFGGKGGIAGGSSIGLVSMGATITMVNVTIKTGKGGAGGVGGKNQPGGAGGLGGDGGAADTPPTVLAACKGGTGGAGGAGGPGGGGSGGHSLGIAYVGTAPTADKVTFDIPPDGGGAGGLGGDNNLKGNSGAVGQSQTTLQFK